MAFDPSNFIAGLLGARERIEKAAAAAVGEYAEQVLADAQELTPVSPVNRKHPLYIGTSGSLRDSGTVGEIEIKNSLIEVEIGFNTNYAAAVHERLDANHQYPGAVNPKAQAKFLEAAMKGRKDQFAPYMAKRIKEALGG